MAQLITIRNEHLTASISTKGAELHSLIPNGGTELIWPGDSNIWPWHAPNLFPIVGALVNDTLFHEGKHYLMKQHGFLRHSLCDVIEVGASAASFRLVDNDETWAQYPFAFDLVITYHLDVDRFVGRIELRNPAATPLYASLGLHPGFNWPLSIGKPETHLVVFDQPELEPVRSLKKGLLAPTAAPTPVAGQVLRLNHTLFDNDALIFDRLASRRLVYGALGGAAIEIDFPDFPVLGIWTKPGDAPFVCLEPWQGYASPEGFSGEFKEKPGVIKIESGCLRIWNYHIQSLVRLPLWITPPLV